MNVRKLIPAVFSALLMQAGPVIADEALADRAGCLDCHSVDEKVTGPTFRDIAARYVGDPDARETLKEIVKNGGKGNWKDTGDVPMPPHWGLLSDSEIESLVNWVLSQGGEE